MKGYTAGDLEKLFERAGRIRKGKSKFANDSTYWESGRCNWGGSHNLHEDCETIASSFAKIEELKEIKETLKSCTSEVEFNSKKRDYLDSINQSINGLRPRTGYSSSMFGICIIWADEAMNPHVEKQIEGCRKEVEKIKSALEKETYKWVEELKQLNLEINQIEARMKENKRKAMTEKDPAKRAILLQMIEDDGELLKQKYAEKQKLENKFNFDPTKKVKDMVDAMRRAIEGKNKDGSGDSNHGGGGNGNGKPDSDEDPLSDDDDDDSEGDSSSGNNSRTPRKRNNQPEQNKQQMIMIAVVAVVVLFLLMNQKEQPHSKYEDYY